MNRNPYGRCAAKYSPGFTPDLLPPAGMLGTMGDTVNSTQVHIRNMQAPQIERRLKTRQTITQPRYSLLRSTWPVPEE